jgi:hypothetical protein
MIKDLARPISVTADSKGVRGKRVFGVDFEGVSGGKEPSGRATRERASCIEQFTSHSNSKRIRCQHLFVW